MQKNYTKTTKAGRWLSMHVSLALNQFGLGFNTIWDRSFCHMNIDFLFLHFQFDFMGKQNEDLELYPEPSDWGAIPRFWDNEADEVWNKFGEEE